MFSRLVEYEDDIQPYLDVTKSVYKELVSVQKDAETQQIQVISPVFKIEALVRQEKEKEFFLFNFVFLYFFVLKNENGKKFYPSRTAYEQDFVYMIVDPIKRHVIILSNFYDGPSFFE